MATYKITAPNTKFCGRIHDVQFDKGVAQTDNAAVIKYCRNAGYTVEGVKTDKQPKESKGVS